MIAKIFSLLILVIPFPKKNPTTKTFQARFLNILMNFLRVLSAVYTGYKAYRTIRQSRDAFRDFRDLIEVFSAFVSGNLSYMNRNWLLGVLRRNLSRLWDIIAPRYFGQLHSLRTTYCLVRDFWHSIRDVYYVSNAWLGRSLTYGDRDRMRSLQR